MDQAKKFFLQRQEARRQSKYLRGCEPTREFPAPKILSTEELNASSEVTGTWAKVDGQWTIRVLNRALPYGTEIAVFKRDGSEQRHRVGNQVHNKALPPYSGWIFYECLQDSERN